MFLCKRHKSHMGRKVKKGTCSSGQEHVPYSILEHFCFCTSLFISLSAFCSRLLDINERFHVHTNYLKYLTSFLRCIYISKKWLILNILLGYNGEGASYPCLVLLAKNIFYYSKDLITLILVPCFQHKVSWPGSSFIYSLSPCINTNNC